jgi:hypothetical protein
MRLRSEILPHLSLSRLISPAFLDSCGFVFRLVQHGQMSPFSLLVFSLSFFLCLANSARGTFCALTGFREMEEDQSAILVAEGAIKSIKLSLSTEEEIVSSPSLVLLSAILAYQDVRKIRNTVSLAFPW